MLRRPPRPTLFPSTPLFRSATGTATLRDRDTTAQGRVPGDELPGLLRRLTDMEIGWDEVARAYPAQAPAAEEEGAE